MPLFRIPGSDRPAWLRILAIAGGVALLLLPVLLAGRSGLSDWTAELGGGAAVEPFPIEAEIVVVTDGRSRVYSSRQLPPDGRVVFARFAAEREHRLGEPPPTEIAAWIFRVVPDADEVRITVRDPHSDGPGRSPGESEPYEYRRESFVTS